MNAKQTAETVNTNPDAGALDVAELDALLAEEAQPVPAAEPAPAKPAAKPACALCGAKLRKGEVHDGESACVKAAKKTAKKAAKPEETPAEAAPVEEAPKVTPPANYLMFVGNSFGYTKEEFTKEADVLGVSKRLPSFRLPAALKVGASKVWLAAAGARKAEAGAKPTSVIFGYFIPDAIEFIAGEDGDATYADIIATVKKMEGGRVVSSKAVEAEPLRKCGKRKVGGTYLVTKKAEDEVSPLVVRPDQNYMGNHFRGMMELDLDQAAKLEKGEGLDVLVAETCMQCTKGFFCSPDGHARAERERRRVEAGGTMKWELKCPACLVKESVAKAKATRAAKKAGAEAKTETGAGE